MKRWFEYHCFESEESADKELWHRTHQQVEILHKLDNIDTEIGKMYRVKFPDGFESDVFQDELMKDPKLFHRPPYLADAQVAKAIGRTSVRQGTKRRTARTGNTHPALKGIK